MSYPTIPDNPTLWQRIHAYLMLKLGIWDCIARPDGKTIFRFNADRIWRLGTDQAWRDSTTVLPRGKVPGGVSQPRYREVGPYLVPSTHGLGRTIVDAGDPSCEHEYYMAPWDPQYGEGFGDIDEEEMAKPGVAFPMATFRDLWKCTGCPATIVTATRALV